MFFKKKVATPVTKCECECESEEKEMRVLALALTLTLFLYPERDLNPHKHYCSQDFKSCVSTIPPSGRFIVLQVLQVVQVVQVVQVF